jgi:hypothetical protein
LCLGEQLPNLAHELSGVCFKETLEVYLKGLRFGVLSLVARQNGADVVDEDFVLEPQMLCYRFLDPQVKAAKVNLLLDQVLEEGDLLF